MSGLAFFVLYNLSKGKMKIPSINGLNGTDLISD